MYHATQIAAHLTVVLLPTHSPKHDGVAAQHGAASHHALEDSFDEADEKTAQDDADEEEAGRKAAEAAAAASAARRRIVERERKKKAAAAAAVAKRQEEVSAQPSKSPEKKVKMRFAMLALVGIPSSCGVFFSCGETSHFDLRPQAHARATQRANKRAYGPAKIKLHRDPLQAAAARDRKVRIQVMERLCCVFFAAH